MPKDYRFRNLIFEGGGVKGIAYAGVMEELSKRNITGNIRRVGGTSAGAINALLFALGYSNTDISKILDTLDFNSFMDDSIGVIRDTHRIFNEFGLYKGDVYKDWVGALVKKKLGHELSTFRDLEQQNASNGAVLYVYGTNLSTGYGEVFSAEHTPNVRLVDAMRITMSIPLFFRAVTDIRGDVFVDGGLLNNFPITLFDRLKYVDAIGGNKISSFFEMTDKHKKANLSYLGKSGGKSDKRTYVYNKQTLGVRLDTAKEIAAFRYGKIEVKNKIEDFGDYAKALISTALDAQQSAHLDNEDWQRTIYVDSLDVKTTDFNLKPAKKKALVASGRAGTVKYFKWYDKSCNLPENDRNRPLNAMN